MYEKYTISIYQDGRVLDREEISKYLRTFNVNIANTAKTLHYNGNLPETTVKDKKGNEYKIPDRLCPHCRSFEAFIPFDSLQDVMKFEEKHGVKFKLCGYCFPPEMRGTKRRR